MPTNDKGSNYERKFARELSLWWTGGEDDAIFWRNKGSGGRATRRSAKGLRTHNASGDICAEHELGLLFTSRVVVELKKGYASWDPIDALDVANRKSRPWYQFIKQVKREAKEAGVPYWWLVVARDRRAPILVVNVRFFRAMGISFASFPDFWANLSYITMRSPHCVLFNLNTFLKTFSGEHVRRLLESNNV